MKRLYCGLCISLLMTVWTSNAVASGGGVPKDLKVVRYFASEDATVSSSAPNMNFGQASRLYAQARDPVQRVYLKFRLHQVIDETWQLFDAELTLTTPTGDQCGGDDPFRGIDVFAVNNPWNEDSITYNNAPAPENYVVGEDEFSAGRLTLNVISDFTQSKTQSYALDMPSDCEKVVGATVFKSGENRTGRPTLTVWFCRQRIADEC